MKIVAVAARIFLGLIFLVFGLNGFLMFIPAPPLSGYVEQFSTAMNASHYGYVVFGFQVLIGVLLLINQYVPLALAMLAPILVNIITFHVTMYPAGIAPGLICSVLWAILVYRYRSHYLPLFVRTPTIGAGSSA